MSHRDRLVAYHLRLFLFIYVCIQNALTPFANCGWSSLALNGTLMLVEAGDLKGDRLGSLGVTKGYVL